MSSPKIWPKRRRWPGSWPHVSSISRTDGHSHACASWKQCVSTGVSIRHSARRAAHAQQKATLAADTALLEERRARSSSSSARPSRNASSPRSASWRASVQMRGARYRGSVAPTRRFRERRGVGLLAARERKVLGAVKVVAERLPAERRRRGRRHLHIARDTVVPEPTKGTSASRCGIAPPRRPAAPALRAHAAARSVHADASAPALRDRCSASSPRAPTDSPPPPVCVRGAVLSRPSPRRCVGRVGADVGRRLADRRRRGATEPCGGRSWPRREAEARRRPSRSGHRRGFRRRRRRQFALRQAAAVAPQRLRRQRRRSPAADEPCGIHRDDGVLVRKCWAATT